MRICFFCGFHGPDYPWGGWLRDSGIGGSEESVFYLAEALERRGHDVTIVNRCHPGTGMYRYQGVGYQSPDYILPDDIDLYVSWRDWKFAVIAKQDRVAPRVWLWCHDIPVKPHWPIGAECLEIAREYIDKVVVLNDHHKRLYTAAGLPEEKALVIPIGIVREQFDVPDPPARIPGRVIACYHPHRGLPALRAAWPEVRRRAPHATLAAFWWQPEFFLPPDEANGILPMRSVGHAELARELMKAEVFAYPSSFDAEISPASCIKAQAAGAFPVAVRVGGMWDVLQWGLWVTHETFADILAKALTPGTDEHDAIDYCRPEMMAWARDEYDWDKVAEMWEREAMA